MKNILWKKYLHISAISELKFGESGQCTQYCKSVFFCSTDLTFCNNCRRQLAMKHSSLVFTARVAIITSFKINTQFLRTENLILNINKINNSPKINLEPVSL